jgi:hypothetical protein
LKRRSKQYEEQQQQARARRQARKIRRPNSPGAAAGRGSKTDRQTPSPFYMELVKNSTPTRNETRRSGPGNGGDAAGDSGLQGKQLPGLLQLQNLPAGRQGPVAGEPADDHLKYYNKLLKEQVDELQQEFYAAHPQYNGSPYGYFYGPPHVQEMQIRRAISETKTTIGQLKHTLTSLDTLPELKDFVKNFDLDDQDDDSLEVLFGRF